MAKEKIFMDVMVAEVLERAMKEGDSEKIERIISQIENISPELLDKIFDYGIRTGSDYIIINVIRIKKDLKNEVIEGAIKIKYTKTEMIKKAIKYALDKGNTAIIKDIAINLKIDESSVDAIAEYGIKIRDKNLLENITDHQSLSVDTMDKIVKYGIGIKDGSFLENAIYHKKLSSDAVSNIVDYGIENDNFDLYKISEHVMPSHKVDKIIERINKEPDSSARLVFREIMIHNERLSDYAIDTIARLGIKREEIGGYGDEYVGSDDDWDNLIGMVLNKRELPTSTMDEIIKCGIGVGNNNLLTDIIKGVRSYYTYYNNPFSGKHKLSDNAIDAIVKYGVQTRNNNLLDDIIKFRELSDKTLDILANYGIEEKNHDILNGILYRKQLPVNIRDKIVEYAKEYKDSKKIHHRIINKLTKPGKNMTRNGGLTAQQTVELQSWIIKSKKTLNRESNAPDNGQKHRKQYERRPALSSWVDSEGTKNGHKNTNEIS